MSWIVDDPDTYEVVSTYTECPCGGLFSGNCRGMCMGSATMSRRYRSAEEVAAIKAEKRRKAEDEILAQADAIRLRRQAGAPAGREGGMDGPQ